MVQVLHSKEEFDKAVGLHQLAQHCDAADDSESLNLSMHRIRLLGRPLLLHRRPSGF
jgi:hypothetical protein